MKTRGMKASERVRELLQQFRYHMPPYQTSCYQQCANPTARIAAMERVVEAAASCRDCIDYSPHKACEKQCEWHEVCAALAAHDEMEGE